MRRGDIVAVSAPGAYGKPRPAVVVQSDWLAGADSVLVCLMTSTLVDAPLFRLTVEPAAGDGLRTVSQVMIDKIVALPRGKCGPVIGRLAREEVVALDRSLSLVLGIAD